MREVATADDGATLNAVLEAEIGTDAAAEMPDVAGIEWTAHRKSSCERSGRPALRARNGPRLVEKKTFVRRDRGVLV